MTDPIDTNDQLERLFESTFRDLPLRQAPATLESQVLRELEFHAARPWWRRSFAHWPAAARAGFVFVCSALGALVFVGGNWTATTAEALHTSGALSLPSAHPAWTLMSAAGEIAVVLSHAVPTAWLYTGLAAGAVLYAMLFGLGAAAYRTLYLTPSNGR